MKRILIHIISALFPTKRLRKKIRKKLHKKSFFPSQNINAIGKNNKVILVSPNGEKEINNVYGFFISITGNNNTIRIPEGYNINGRIDINSDDCLIDIRSTKYLNLNVSTFSQSGQKLVVDTGTVIYGALMFLNEKNASILIGKDCLFSGDIVIWPTDGHAILDQETEKIFNSIRHPVIIGDHCWIGYGVFMTKNTYLASDTIVGAKSVVSKGFKESNIILAGNPAQIIKTGVQWHHQTPAFLEDERKQKE